MDYVPNRYQAAGSGIGSERHGAAPLARLVDRQQLAERMSMCRSDFSGVIETPGFPAPAGYFRGRTLWDEASVEVWLRDRRQGCLAGPEQAGEPTPGDSLAAR